MSDPTDIAARAERFRDAVHAFTSPTPKRHRVLMPLKQSIIDYAKKLRHCALCATCWQRFKYQSASTPSRAFSRRRVATRGRHDHASGLRVAA